MFRMVDNCRDIDGFIVIIFTETTKNDDDMRNRQLRNNSSEISPNRQGNDNRLPIDMLIADFAEKNDVRCDDNRQ